jgi:hypothetical protein
VLSLFYDIVPVPREHEREASAADKAFYAFDEEESSLENKCCKAAEARLRQTCFARRPTGSTPKRKRSAVFLNQRVSRVLAKASSTNRRLVRSFVTSLLFKLFWMSLQMQLLLRIVSIMHLMMRLSIGV